MHICVQYNSTYTTLGVESVVVVTSDTRGMSLISILKTLWCTICRDILYDLIIFSLPLYDPGSMADVPSARF